MSRFSHRCMEGLDPRDQALKAINHVLNRMKADDRIYHLIGEGSQSFDLLTEAFSSLTGRHIEEVRHWIASAERK